MDGKVVVDVTDVKLHRSLRNQQLYMRFTLTWGFFVTGGAPADHISWRAEGCLGTVFNGDFMWFPSMPSFFGNSLRVHRIHQPSPRLYDLVVEGLNKFGAIEFYMKQLQKDVERGIEHRGLLSAEEWKRRKEERTAKLRAAKDAEKKARAEKRLAVLAEKRAVREAEKAAQKATRLQHDPPIEVPLPGDLE